MCCYVGVRGLDGRDGAGDVEDAVAASHGRGDAGRVQQVRLEQPQPLAGAAQRRQVRVLGVTCMVCIVKFFDDPIDRCRESRPKPNGRQRSRAAPWIDQRGRSYRILRAAGAYRGREQCHARGSRLWRGGAARATRRRSPRRPSRTPSSSSSWPRRRRRPWLCWLVLASLDPPPATAIYHTSKQAVQRTVAAPAVTCCCTWLVSTGKCTVGPVQNQTHPCGIMHACCLVGTGRVGWVYVIHCLGLCVETKIL